MANIQSKTEHKFIKNHKFDLNFDLNNNRDYIESPEGMFAFVKYHILFHNKPNMVRTGSKRMQERSCDLDL